MGELIAGIYEIERKIGSGGGGVVYLGRHRRLNKAIVLKADRRRLSTNEEKLRREVDFLKSMSHSYIPQVYDFVEQDGIVYTVMDYIEGESLDKLLARNQVLSQRDGLRMMAQALEALDYMHNRPGNGILHGDIKPANIMMRPDGSICLIDFNIALALGEDGAVSVGYSKGYASPEHYSSSSSFLGDSYLSASELNSRVVSKTTSAKDDDVTVVSEYNDRTILDDDDDKTLFEAEAPKKSVVSVNRTADSATGSEKKIITLDVRSDIYSLGAAFYHLLTGRKPANSATDVIPLNEKDVSSSVADIINKAMRPEPGLRYQSAAEMLFDIKDIKKKDVRTIRHRRRQIISFACIFMIFAIGIGMTFLGQHQLGQIERSKVLAAKAEKLLINGDRDGAIEIALDACEIKGLLHAPLPAQAQKSLTDALGVYDLKDGWNIMDSIPLPEKVLKTALSPSGDVIAVFYPFKIRFCKTGDLSRIGVIETYDSALCDMVFIDEEHILYASPEGVCLYEIQDQDIIWTGKPATAICVSGDKKTGACIFQDDTKAYVFRISDGSVIKEIDMGERHLKVPVNDQFEDPEYNLFALNKDGSYLAVSDLSGGLMLYDTRENEQDDLVVFEESEWSGFSGGFAGDYFVFCAFNSDGSEFNALSMNIDGSSIHYESMNTLVMDFSDRFIYLAEGGLLTETDLSTSSQREVCRVKNGNIIDFDIESDHTSVILDTGIMMLFDNYGNEIYSRDIGKKNGCCLGGEGFTCIASQESEKVNFYRMISGADFDFFNYDPDYDHTEARYDPEDSTVVLFSPNGMRIYHTGGMIISDTKFENSDEIYDQQFVKEDGAAYLDVTYYDGKVERYSMKDGSLSEEKSIDPPSKDLYEEFETKDYIIRSSLHGKPQVYTKDGRYLLDIEEEAFLTYVTELEDGYVLEFMKTEEDGAFYDMKRYGILTDRNFEDLAVLEGLCDINENELYFDFYNGVLRKVHIYTLDELRSKGWDRMSI